MTALIDLAPESVSHIGDHTDHVDDPPHLYFADESDNNASLFDAKKYHAAGGRHYACKATQGLTGTQGPYRARVDEAHSVGLGVVHYHFAEAAQGDPEGQMRHFLGTVIFHHGDHLVIDLETPGLSVEQTIGWKSAAFDYLHSHGHPAAPLYTDLAFLQQYGAGLVPPSGNLWIADYGRPSESLESIWRDVESSLPGGHLWALQYTDGVHGPDPHTLPGIGGLCDVSKLAATL